MRHTKIDNRHLAQFYAAVAGLLLTTSLVSAGPSYSLTPPPKPSVPGKDDPAQPVSTQVKANQLPKYIITVTTTPDKGPAAVQLFYNTPERGNRVLMQARVPEKAQVWFEDRPTTQTGESRLFVSPPLTPGQRYTYHLRVQWMEGDRPYDQERTITVQPGDRINLDFGR
jgi:uncharacterized protein (TIGR03000 family)